MVGYAEPSEDDRLDLPCVRSRIVAVHKRMPMQGRGAGRMDNNMLILYAMTGFVFGTLAMRTVCTTWRGATVCGAVIALATMALLEPITGWIVYG